MAKKTDTKTETTDLQTTGTTAMAVHDYGDDAVDLGQTGRGYEGQTAEDTAMPWISLQQPISPIIVEGKIDGCKAGDWVHTISNFVWSNPKGLVVVPAFTRHEYIQFVPRKLGGGFVARYDITDEVVAKSKAENKARGGDFGKYYVDADGRAGEQGDELTETFTVFCVPCDGDEPMGGAIISFKGTMIKCYKNWMSQIRAHQVPGPNNTKKTPPIFAHLSRFVTEMQKNEHGIFWVPRYEPAINKSVATSCLAPDDPRFLMAKAVNAMVASGEAKVDYNKTADDGLPKDASGKNLF